AGRGRPRKTTRTEGDVGCPGGCSVPAAYPTTAAGGSPRVLHSRECRHRGPTPVAAQSTSTALVPVGGCALRTPGRRRPYGCPTVDPVCRRHVHTLSRSSDPGVDTCLHSASIPRVLGMNERAHGQLDLLLLSVLATRPAHGYAVIAALRERSSGEFDLPEGTVYP